ncbi:MAG: protein tyrosine phosphatase family protein [Pseudomonadota bacterium]
MREKITTSGQPSAAQLTALKAADVTTIINLAPHDHPRSLKDEAAICAGLGLNYIHIPVAFDTPRQSDYDRFRRAMDSHAHDHVHVHCIVNARVSAFFYRYDQETGLLSEADARTRMQAIWNPGGVWAEFIGDMTRTGEDHLYAGRDYPRFGDE